MKHKFLKLSRMWAVMAALLVVQSCSDDPQPMVKPGEAGFFIVNEGGFGNGNTSISFYDRKTDEVTNNVFAVKNGRPLGDQAQSMTVFEGKGYIVVQNSAKIEVIDPDDYSSLATISTGLPSPRYFVGISATKAYVSDWGADGITGTVKVLDLTTNTVTSTIATGKGANKMLKVNNLVYVANSGGFDKDNTVKVIDSNTDAIVSTITVGDNPNSLQRDKDGNIWVSSGGAIAFDANFNIDVTNSTKGSISKINSSNTETLRLSVDKVTYSAPSSLSIDPTGAMLYYTYDDKVYSMATSATALPTAAFKNESYYGLSVDPINGNVLGFKAPNFSSAGTMEILTQTGSLVKTYTVGIGPNGCAFK
jgi:YVTN family beta-propeller protein